MIHLKSKEAAASRADITALKDGVLRAIWINSQVMSLSNTDHIFFGKWRKPSSATLLENYAHHWTSLIFELNILHTNLGNLIGDMLLTITAYRTV